MKRVLSILCVALLSALLVAAAGCEESQRPQTGDKKARLVFSENSSLKQQINSLQQQLQQQKDLVAGCQQEKVRIKGLASGIEPNMLKIHKEMARRDMRLTAENNQLKAEIADLKATTKD